MNAQKPQYETCYNSKIEENLGDNHSLAVNWHFADAQTDKAGDEALTSAAMNGHKW